MGQLKSQVLGDATGKVGHLVFRIRKGGNLIAKAPIFPKRIPNATEVALRAKFRLTSKATHAIYSVDKLKAIWPQPTGKMTKYNEIFQANYPFIGTIENLGTISVSPMYGFNLVNPVITIGATSVQLAADALGIGIGIDTSVEKFAIICGVAVLSNPTILGWPESDIVSFKSMQHNLDLINDIDLTANLGGENLTKFTGYTTRTAYVCLLTLDDNGKGIRYSVTAKSL